MLFVHNKTKKQKINFVLISIREEAGVGDGAGGHSSAKENLYNKILANRNGETRYRYTRGEESFLACY